MTSVKSVNTSAGITEESGISKWNSAFFIPEKTFNKTTIGTNTAETQTELKIVDKGAKKYFAYPQKIINIDMDGNRDTVFYTFNETDCYITEEKTRFDGNKMYITKQYGDYIKVGGAYKPQLLTTVQKHSDDNSVFTQKTKFEYNAKGLPVKKIDNFGTPMPLTTEFTGYDDYGNCTSYRVGGEEVSAISFYREFDATKRFVAKTYTSPASTISAFEYDTHGNMLKEKDATDPANIVETNHSYDGWGRRVQSVFHDGRRTKYQTGWGTAASMKYFTLVQGDAIPWVKTWYDAQGREVLSETVEVNNVLVTKQITYNNLGQATTKSTSHGNDIVSESFAYDARGRLTSHSSSSGKSASFSYGNRSQTTNSNGRQYTKTFDACVVMININLFPCTSTRIPKRQFAQTTDFTHNIGRIVSCYNIQIIVRTIGFPDKFF